MHAASRRRLLALATATAAISSAGVLGARATVGSGAGPGADLAARWNATAPGPDRVVRALALTPGGGTRVFAGSGIEASVVSDETGRCLLRTGSRAAGATCGTRAEIDAGDAITVTDECGAGEGDRMTISGLAPRGTTAVRLQRTDGSYEESAVQAGAFLFVGANPTPGAPYPDAIRWLGADGSPAGGASLPVEGDRFCIAAPESPTG
jgi:hypothetical protein